MKRKISVFVFFLISILLQGCMIFSTPTGQGFIFTDQESPFAVVDADLPSEENLKIGRAECFNLFGLFSYGDCSIHAALQDGGITKIYYIDKEANSIFFIGSSVVTVIYGE